MWSVHPNAFQDALTPIPRNGVVGVRVVPIDHERAAIERCKDDGPSSEEMLPTRIRFTNGYFTQLFVHNFGSSSLAVLPRVSVNLFLTLTMKQVSRRARAQRRSRRRCLGS